MAEVFPSPDSQPQNTILAVLAPFLNGLTNGRTIEEVLAHNHAEFEKLAPRIRKQYGVSDSWSVREIIKAEREQKLCTTCSGEPCKKTVSKYYRPAIHVKNGEVVIRGERCKVGVARDFSHASKFARIPKKYVGKTFDDYEVTADNQRAVKLAKTFVKCKPSAGLYIFGGYGTGKTFLASIIAQNFMQDFRRVVFGDVPNLMELIKQSFDSDAQNPLETYCNCDLLILDDIGAGQITEWNVGQLYQIINARYNAELPVIITSNLDFDGLKKTFGNSTGDRIISRLSEICTLAFLGTNDRRKSKC